MNGIIGILALVLIFYHVMQPESVCEPKTETKLVETIATPEAHEVIAELIRSEPRVTRVIIYEDGKAVDDSAFVTKDEQPAPEPDKTET